MITIIAIAFN